MPSPRFSTSPPTPPVVPVRGLCLLPILAVLIGSACRSPEAWRKQADSAAQRQLQSRADMFPSVATLKEIERPSAALRRRLRELQGLPTWVTEPAHGASDATPLGDPWRITLADALRLGARHSREYQEAKETVFRAALALDLKEEQFRSSLIAALSGAYRRRGDRADTQEGLEGTGTLTAEKTWASGLSLAAHLTADVVKLLTLDRDAVYGLMADATVTLPLFRGFGRDVVMEPLRQAERNLLYALADYERFRRDFAVRIAGEYLAALQQWQAVRNAEANAERLALTTTRAERLAEAGRFSETQVDQARQDLLRARERVVTARLQYEERLDRLKLSLGVPPDVRIALDEEELLRLEAAAIGSPPSSGGGSPAPVPQVDPWVSPPPTEDWIQQALHQRLDLWCAKLRVEDAQRAARVAADALRSGASLEISGSVGERRGLESADRENARLDVSRGNTAVRLKWEWPWRRTAARNAYRESLLNIGRAQRAAEELEDRIKSQIRAAARNLQQAEASLRIQQQAVAVAKRRIDSVELFLQAGRAQIRDLLEAQEALLAAQNARTAAAVARRLADLELLRDMEQLRLTDDGLWEDLTHDPP